MSQYQELFNYMQDNHDVILLEQDMNEIFFICQKIIASGSFEMTIGMEFETLKEEEPKMTGKNYEDLERLLAKLGQEFKGGSYRWLLFPNYMDDLPNMTMFSHSGKKLASRTALNIEQCVRKINEDLKGEAAGAKEG